MFFAILTFWDIANFIKKSSVFQFYYKLRELPHEFFKFFHFFVFFGLEMIFGNNKNYSGAIRFFDPV